MTNILVTGGRGTLGSALIPRLIAAGHTVRSASRSLPGPDADPRVSWRQMDLATGDGIAEAVAGVDVIAHAATGGWKEAQRVDIEGTQRLLDAAKAAGVKHFLYISIIAVERIDAMRSKAEAERLIVDSGIPYSILRAAQFYSLPDTLLSMLTRLPVAPVDPSWTLQPIDEGEVADRMVEVVAAGPSGRVPDIAGPEVLTMRDLTLRWKAARGVKRAVLWLRYPGKTWNVFREGLVTTQGKPYGRITWEQWLSAHYRLPEGQARSTQQQAQGRSKA